MKKYLGEEIIEDLTSNFTTTDYNSYLVSKLSIMGSFKKYFTYVMHMHVTCGSPYIILEGTEEDYKSIISKAKKLRKYEFEWYIDRIIPCVEKMVQAKQGNIDIKFFKNIINYEYVHMFCGGNTYIFGWILKFLYREEEKKRYNRGIIFIDEEEKEKDERNKEEIKDYIDVQEFDKLSSQTIIVPFKVKYDDPSRGISREFDMNYKVGFIGCDQNEKNEVYPVQGWIVSLGAEEKEEKHESSYDFKRDSLGFMYIN